MAQPEEIPRDDLVELPLFPLNLVLFPGMVQPLHIFEERYKAMIGDCIDRESPFGIALIREGQEVGDPAEPFQVGTTARITQVQRMDDGRMNILTRGERRFRVVQVIQWAPHVVGLVQYLADQPSEVSESLVEEISGEYATFLRHMSALSGGWNNRVETPTDPERLATEAQANVASTIEWPTDIRQQLLESSTVQQRLERLLPLLQRGNRALQERVDENNPFRGNRLN